MMTKCKHLVRDPSWRKPPHCIKLKVDEPGRLGLCHKCMFREAEPEAKEEPGSLPLENHANMIARSG